MPDAIMTVAQEGYSDAGSVQGTQTCVAPISIAPELTIPVLQSKLI